MAFRFLTQLRCACPPSYSIGPWRNHGYNENRRAEGEARRALRKHLEVKLAKVFEEQRPDKVPAGTNTIIFTKHQLLTAKVQSTTQDQTSYLTMTFADIHRPRCRASRAHPALGSGNTVKLIQRYSVSVLETGAHAALMRNS